MRRSLTALGIAALATALVGCGPVGRHAQGPAVSKAAAPGSTHAVQAATATTTAGHEPTALTTGQPTRRSVTTVHFTTPQAAMRYLAAAYNRNDTAALKKVTGTSARTDLIAMRRGAVNLQLESCSRRTTGDYLCAFRHDFPKQLHRRGTGDATFIVAPADKPGWYMNSLADCD